MKISYAVVTLLFFALSFVTAQASDSISRGFDALEKKKPQKQTVSGMDGFDTLGKAKKENAFSGHGIEAAFADVEVDRNEKKVQAEHEKRRRMEAEAKKNDSDMENSCYCVYNNCPVLKFTETVSCWKDGRDPCQERSEWNKVHPYENAEKKRQEKIAAANKKEVCDAWKAAGPKANSESFKALLKTQDKAIENARRNAVEVEKKRDAIIDAQIKQKYRVEDIAIEADRKAKNDADDMKIRAEKAKNDAINAEKEEKNRRWCMEDTRRLDLCVWNDPYFLDTFHSIKP
jgi:hypothetical protein